MPEAATESVEIERKYEVSVGAELPSSAEFAAAGFTASDPRVQPLIAVYFDTPDRALAAIDVAVRRRTGGKDAGWHLKERRPDGAKELLWGESDEMPMALRADIEGRIGTSELVPLATLETSRTIVVLRDKSGSEVVELADDAVHAVDHARGIRRAWREWEAEVLPNGDRSLLDSVETVLIAAGGTPSPSIAKVARASGALIDLAIARGADPRELAVLGVLDVADRLGATVAGAAPEEGAPDPHPEPRIAQLHSIIRDLGLGWSA